MSKFDLIRYSSMEEYTPKENFGMKKNYSTNDVSGLTLNKNYRGNFNKTTYQPYIPNYPKRNGSHPNSPANGIAGYKDFNRNDSGRTLGNFESNPSQSFTTNAPEHCYTDRYNNGGTRINSGSLSGGYGANNFYKDNAGVGDLAVNGDKKNSKAAKGESEHVCLSGKYLEEFRTRQCPLYAKGMCLNSSRCSLSHSETWPRRNPVLVKYDYKLCPNIQFSRHDNKMQLHGKCSFGRRCRFSHSKEEQLYHPELYKTRYCLNYPNCKGYYCPFAHSKDELRNFQPSTASGVAKNGGNSNLNSTVAITPSSPPSGVLNNTITGTTSGLNSVISSANSNGAGSVSSGSTGVPNSGANSPVNTGGNPSHGGSGNKANTNGSITNGSNKGVTNGGKGGTPLVDISGGTRSKYRSQRDNNVYNLYRGRNDLNITTYETIEEEDKKGTNCTDKNDEHVLSTVPSAYRVTDTDERSYKGRDEWTIGFGCRHELLDNYGNTEDFNTTYRGRNDDLLSNSTSAYSTYNVDDFDLDISSTYDNLVYPNFSGNDSHTNYGNKLFRDGDRHYNLIPLNDNPYSPSVVSEKEELASDANFKNEDRDEEDDNWFESLIKNGLDSLEDNNQQSGVKSWLNQSDLQEIFDKIPDCSTDINCPFCSIKEYKFADSEQLLKLSEDVFKTWSCA